MEETRRRHLSILLWLIAIHSLSVGAALIVLPTSVMEWFGYVGYSGRFFQMQGGVFHLIMAFIYVMAARQLPRSTHLVMATVWIKSIATVFLLSYFLFIESVVMVLVSGLADAGMGALVFVFYRRYRFAQTA